MEQIGIAVIGCGYWGWNYVRVFSELLDSRVVAVCDRRTDRLERVKRRFPGVELTTSVKATLALNEVDAVVVCTEATSHYQIVTDCLAAGRHVLVEKPMTTSVSAAEELIRRASARGVTLMVGHTFLYNAGVKKVKEYIARGDVGRVYYLYARRTNLGPIRDDVNALWDLAPHDVSIFNYLMDGGPHWVCAVGARVLGNGREDVGFVSLGYRDGIIGHVHVSWADPHKVREVVVVGSDKRIVFNDLDAQGMVRVFEKGVKPIEPDANGFGKHQLLIRDGDIIIPKLEVSEPLKNQSSHFLDCVSQGRRPLTDGANGLEVVRVMEAVDRSIRLGGSPVEVAQERAS
ncbi:MAG: Gfo/Idh/MocA family oxidoreductase [Anaerolineales bacterium]|nr:MAG: Gfo/Idh/MocA family oxidoreductase [Anaerolineales bacterium]